MSFHSHPRIRIEVTIWKRSNWSQIVSFSSSATLKFERWLWKIIEHLFYATSSLVHHFKPSVSSNCSYSPETCNSGQNWRSFAPRDIEIWRKTLKNNRAPFLYYFFVRHIIYTYTYDVTGRGPIGPYDQIRNQFWYFSFNLSCYFSFLSLIFDSSLFLYFNEWMRTFERLGLWSKVTSQS